jgi:hypothetical protein
LFKPDWHPLWTLANASLAALRAAAPSAAALAAHVRAFVNDIGSATDVAGAVALLDGLGLQAAWLGVGLDCPPATCTDASGKVQVPPPHAVAAAALADKAALLPPRTWLPLTVMQVVEAVAGAPPLPPI